MADLFERLGWMSRVLVLVAYLVVLVSAGAILASIYNTINERRREFAILRALGARRRTVFSAIVIEAASIALIGSLLGLAVYAAILSTAAYIIRQQTGVVLDLGHLHPAIYFTPLGMTLLGAVAGYAVSLWRFRGDAWVYGIVTIGIFDSTAYDARSTLFSPPVEKLFKQFPAMLVNGDELLVRPSNAILHRPAIASPGNI